MAKITYINHALQMVKKAYFSFEYHIFLFCMMKKKMQYGNTILVGSSGVAFGNNLELFIAHCTAVCGRNLSVKFQEGMAWKLVEWYMYLRVSGQLPTKTIPQPYRYLSWWVDLLVGCGPGGKLS